MARRRQDDDTTSLDLFLDTVSNMFGGIIFITILLAIMAFANAEQVPGRHGLTSEEVNAVLAGQAGAVADRTQRLRDLQDELTELHKMLDLFEDGAADSDEAIEAQRRQMNDRVADALLDLEGKRLVRDSLAGRLENFRGEVSDAEQDIVLLHEKIMKVRQEINEQRKKRRVDARLPVERRTEKFPLHVVLKSGKLHELYDRTDPTSERAEARDVVLTKSPNQHSFTLKPEGGYPVTASVTRHPRWRELMSLVTPKSYYFYIMVYPDSYEAFLTVKTTVLAAGFEYQIEPMPPGSAIELVVTLDHTTQ